MKTINELIQNFRKLQSARQNWDSHFNSLAFYFLPRKENFTISKIPGSEINLELYDSTGRESLLILAAGLHGYLTNPTSKWFALRIQDEELMKSQNVREWLKECEERIFDALNSSNFNNQIHETYLDLACFGTACLYVEEDPEDLIRFYSIPLSEIYIAENERKKVDMIFRFVELTAREAYQKWGGNAGEKTLALLETNPFEKVQFLHIVFPREEYNPAKRDSLNKPFASVWIEYESQHKIAEGGYEEFPFFVPRFAKISGEIYGYSPAMEVLPDMRMLNKIHETLIRQAEKLVNPPLDVPEGGYYTPLDISPGAINYRRQGLGKEEIIRQLLPGSNLPIGAEMIRLQQEKIRRAFFVDLFLLLAQRPQMTATEVLQRVEEKMLLLGPALGRLMNELLDPLIARTFNILARLGKLSSPPEEIAGKDYVIEYISPLARAQKLSESKSLQNYFLLIGEMAKIAPSILENIDVDEIAREYADIQGISPKILRDDEEVEQIRQQKAQILQAQQILEMAKQGAEVLEKGAKASAEQAS